MLTGTWTGTTTPTAAGVGNVRVTFAQSGSSLSGTWISTYANTTANGGGTLTGAINGNAITVTLNSSVIGACAYSVNATLTNFYTMTGTFSTINCLASLGGGVTLTSQ